MAEIIQIKTPYTGYYDDGSIEEEGTLNRDGKKQGKVTRWFKTGEKQYEGTYVNGIGEGIPGIEKGVKRKEKVEKGK